ncbi:MAG: hypothetical protein V1728_01315 [Candidatus Micrarchaeota archaeon]
MPGENMIPDPEQDQPPVRKIEIHIVVGCSDARDIPPVFNAARELEIKTQRARGIYIDFQHDSVAGVFVTPDVEASLRKLIMARLDYFCTYAKLGIPIEIFVHLVDHGDVRLKKGADGSQFSLHEIEVADENSPTNCGMRHAEEVAQELEVELLEKQVDFLFTELSGRRRHWQIRDGNDIRAMMKYVYEHDGLIAAGWVHSITDFGRHAAEQKAILRHAIDTGPYLRLHGLMITAGVQNFKDNTYYRVDENTHLITFLDRVYERMREMIKNGWGNGDTETRKEKQVPLIGTFHISEISNARQTAITLFKGKEFRAAQVFAIGGRLLTEYYRPFGGYKIMSFYYGVRHLGLKDWVVVGRNQNEVDMIIARIRNDPLMDYISKAYAVNLVPIISEGIPAQEPGAESNE